MATTTAKKTTAKKATTAKAPTRTPATAAKAKATTAEAKTTAAKAKATTAEAEATREEAKATAEQVERTFAALVRDGAYATVGAADASLDLLKQLSAKGAEVRDEARNLANREELSKRVGSLRDEVTGSARKLREDAVEEFDTLVGRGRGVVTTVRVNTATERAVAQARAARSQLKAAATSARNALRASAESAEVAAEVVAE